MRSLLNLFFQGIDGRQLAYHGFIATGPLNEPGQEVSGVKSHVWG